MAIPAGVRGPLTAQRLVRLALRRWRDASGRTQEHVAAAMDWSIAKVIRTESGATTISLNDLRALAEMYAIGGSELADLLGLARMSRQRPWWTQYREWMPRPRLLAGAFMDEAQSSMGFSTTIIPELLRTEAYARAVLSAQDIAGREAELRLEVQRRRSDDYLRGISADDRRQVRFVVDEAALHRAVGGRFTQSEQLDHLLSLPHWRVALRVLPFEAAGLGATDAFTVAVLADDEGLVFVDATADGVLLDRPEDFVAYRRVFERLWEGALDEAASAEMIKSRR